MEFRGRRKKDTKQKNEKIGRNEERETKRAIIARSLEHRDLNMGAEAPLIREKKEFGRGTRAGAGTKAREKTADTGGQKCAQKIAANLNC